MSIVYSHISDKYLDLDTMDVVQLSDGDYVAMDDDANLIVAYEKGLLTDEQMEELGFDSMA